LEDVESVRPKYIENFHLGSFSQVSLFQRWFVDATITAGVGNVARLL